MAKDTKENEVVKTQKSTVKKATNKTKTSKKTTNKSTSKNSTSRSPKTTDKRKEVEIKKNKKEGMVGMIKKLFKSVKNHKLISITIMSTIILFIIALIITPIILSNKKVITIGDYDYSKNDFMIYLYSVKYNYFGKDNTNLPEATLNTLVDESGDTTIREFLKEKTVSEIKTAGVIQKLAKDYNIKLSDKDEEALLKEKEEFIENLGGKKAFKKMLRDNNTTEDAYDKMSRTDRLYKLIYQEIYDDGKIEDLTDEEKVLAEQEYYSSYKKIRQIVLATIDLETNKSLDTTTINQKETLATAILNEAKSGVDFNELIKKYSEDVTDNDTSYEIYYKDGQLLEEIENAVNNLNVGDISEVIKSKYAFHIIIRDALDDGKLNNVFQTKREEKLLKNISETLKEVPVIYHNSYENIKIK